MQDSHSIFSLLRRLWPHISARRRGQFGLLLVLMVIASFAEIFSIGAVLPFLGVLTAPERVFSQPLAQPFIQALGLTTASQLLLPLTVIFGLTALAAGGARLLLLWASTRLSFATGSDLSINIYRRTLYQPYAVHISRNSSEIINGITNKTNGVIGAISMVLTLLGSGVMLIAILFALLAVSPVIALAAFAGFGLIYASIITFTRKKLVSNSQHMARESTQVIKSLQEGLGGIRDVLIDGSQAAYCKIYSDADRPSRIAQGSSAFISASPRYVTEALGMLLIGGLAYSLALEVDGVAKAIPVLGSLALGAQRLLPVLQQSYAAWSNIVAGQASLQDAIDLLEQPLPDFADQPAASPLPFHKSIQIKQLAFRYAQGAPYVLQDISLSIPKGSRVGFIGTTGSGKSTLLDIVMGLLQPTQGELLVDGVPVTAVNCRSWQSHIAHVPQNIFLADSSIEENIAFGVPKDQINHELVRLAARQAQIAEIVETWPEGYQTFVGERGIRLSGGQRQRIGIARALYKQADVIIFDEATSALDNETEQSVMDAIEGLSGNLTVLIIAHRLSTLKNCTQIVELEKAGVHRVGDYQSLIENTARKASASSSDAPTI